MTEEDKLRIEAMKKEAELALKAKEVIDSEVRSAINLMSQQVQLYNKSIEDLNLQIETENRFLDGLVNERQNLINAGANLSAAIRVLKSSRGE